MAILGEPYAGMLRQQAAATGTDPALVGAVAAAEGSNGNPAARSWAGAVGIMQLMPDTARALGLVVDDARDDRLDPALNIAAGVRLLHALSNTRGYAGRLDLIAAAYNAGPGAVAAAGNAVPGYEETRAYVANVAGYYAQLAGAGAPLPVAELVGSTGSLLPVALVLVGVIVIAGVIA